VVSDDITSEYHVWETGPELSFVTVSHPDITYGEQDRVRVVVSDGITSGHHV
ncbi:hypothetical protein LOTGIDRAFT_140510, partial [Lottia gigantea]